MERFAPNGDIYINDKMVCHSYERPIPILDVTEIKERIVKKLPIFDGTIIRAYFTGSEWKLATMKKDAFNSKWKSEKSFGELFEKHKPVEMLKSFLRKEYCYTFLLIDTECENYLTHTKDELFYINSFDCYNKKYVDCKPLFCISIPSLSESLGWVDRNETSKGIQIKRPQRGMIVFTKNNLYIQDFDYFKFWKNIIKNHSHIDTFWYLVKTREEKFVKEFIDYYGKEYDEKYYYLMEFLNACNVEYDKSIEFENKQIGEYYKQFCLLSNNARKQILELPNSELEFIVKEFKSLVLKNELLIL